MLFETYFRYDEVTARSGELWRGFAGITPSSVLVLVLLLLPIVWRLLDRLNRAQQQRESLLQRAVDASNQERRHIAGTLHDGVVQDLVATSFTVAAAAELAAAQEDPVLAADLRSAAGTVAPASGGRGRCWWRSTRRTSRPPACRPPCRTSRFDGRSSLRTWLHRIATNACLDTLSSAQRRILPSGLGSPTDSLDLDLSRLAASPWLQPAPTADLLDRPDDPAAIVALRDSTRLALIAAYQVLPVRQRAVLLLVDVVAFAPDEVADLLGLSVTAVRSLLQRARSTIAGNVPDQDRVVPSPELDTAVLRSYLAAFESGDAQLLANLLRAEVSYEMPPIAHWFKGRAAVVDHHRRRVFTQRRTAMVSSANGYPAMAMYAGAADGSFRAHGLHVLEQHGGGISRIVVFLEPDLFPMFDLPATLAAGSG